MHSSPGFTLMEVLVALVVAAVLAAGLAALQRHGLNQVRDGDALWEHINLAQEALLGQDVARMRDDTGWRWAGEYADVRWRASPAPALEDRPGEWMVLVTSTPDRILEWFWPNVRP